MTIPPSPHRLALRALLASAACAALLAAPAPTAHAKPAAAQASPTFSQAGATLPGDSLYRLDAGLTDANGSHFVLRDMAGAPLLVTMFYGDCNAACPIIIETLKRTVAALGPRARALRVLMISLDPLNDAPPGLARLADAHQLDRRQFRLAVASDESQTRMLAAALGIRFRAMDGGQINHTTRIVLLDGAGRVQAASARLDAVPDPAFLKQLAHALGTPPAP